MYQLGVTKIEHRLSPFSMDFLVAELSKKSLEDDDTTSGLFAEYFKQLSLGEDNSSFESKAWPSSNFLQIFSEQIDLIHFWSKDVSLQSPIRTHSTD